jgi:hypothetical protein
MKQKFVMCGVPGASRGLDRLVSCSRRCRVTNCEYPHCVFSQFLLLAQHFVLKLFQSTFLPQAKG